MRPLVILSALCVAASGYAQTTPFPGNPIVVNSLSTSGTSFVYSGVLTGDVPLSLTASGTPCLQSGVYCTNAAGVVVIAGSLPVGQSFQFTGPLGGVNGTWTVGSLLMSISGVGTVQVFPTTTANGLMSSAPPSSLSLSGVSLSSLGFGSFSVTNPTVTLLFADNQYPDNSGSFTVSGSFGVRTAQASAPALSPAAMVTLGLLLAAVAVMLQRRPMQTGADR